MSADISDARGLWDHELVARAFCTSMSLLRGVLTMCAYHVIRCQDIKVAITVDVEDTRTY